MTTTMTQPAATPNDSPAATPADGAARRRRVLLVDDHPIVRRGLGQMIADELDLELCGEAEDAAGALEAVARLSPDIAVVDLSLAGRGGLDLIKELRTQYPALPVLVLSMHDEALHAERVLRAGAKGYIMKQEAAERVIEAVRHVLGGGVYLSDRIAPRLLAGTSPATGDRSSVTRLSDREFEVYTLIGQGLTPRVIAERLGLSVKTVEAHRENMKGKLGLASSNELIRHAMQYAMDHHQGAKGTPTENR